VLGAGALRREFRRLQQALFSRGAGRTPFGNSEEDRRERFQQAVGHIVQILEGVKKDISEADKGTTAAGPPAAADTSTGGAGGKGGGAPVSQYVFRPRGEYYDVQFGKASALLAAKGRQGTYLLGPRYIAALLAKPDHIFSAMDLWIIGQRTWKRKEKTTNPADIAEALKGDDVGRQRVLSGGLPESRQTIGAYRETTAAKTVLSSTVELYRDAVHVLEMDLEKADDPVEKTRLTKEIELLRREIDRLYSPSCSLKTLHDRRRARINAINQAMKRAYKSIDDLETPIPGLRDHLEGRIFVSGGTFSYRPSSPPLDWQIW